MRPTSRPPAMVTRADVRNTHRREEALLDNFQLVRFLQEDAWKPNEEATVSGYIDAAERRDYEVRYLATEGNNEFWAIRSKKTLATVAYIHGDHTGAHLIPTEEK